LNARELENPQGRTLSTEAGWRRVGEEVFALALQHPSLYLQNDTLTYAGIKAVLQREDSKITSNWQVSDKPVDEKFTPLPEILWSVLKS
jgi:hypothetical protein